MVIYFGLRMATLSGGAYKVTIPIEIFREVWKKLEGGRPRSIPICFMERENAVILELLENVLEGEYSEEIRKSAYEEWKKYLYRTVQEKLDRLIDGIAKGKTHFTSYYQMLENLKEDIDSTIKPYMKSLKGALAFASDELESIIAAATLEAEKEKEEEFGQILDEIRNMIERKREIEITIAKIERRKELERDFREMIKQRLLYELSMIEDRLGRIKALLENE